MSSSVHSPGPVHAPDPLVSAPPTESTPAAPRWSVALTSFFFILLQSFCAFAMAVSSVRFVIGAGALAGAFGLIRPVLGFHAAIYRIPMMAVALAGSVLNLYLISRIRSLRARASSQWRLSPPTHRQLVSENLQIALSVLTLVLVVLEEALHILYHGF